MTDSPMQKAMEELRAGRYRGRAMFSSPQISKGEEVDVVVCDYEKGLGFGAPAYRLFLDGQMHAGFFWASPEELTPILNDEEEGA